MQISGGVVVKREDKARETTILQFWQNPESLAGRLVVAVKACMTV